VGVEKRRQANLFPAASIAVFFAQLS